MIAGFYIYGLIDPLSGQLRYIGQTVTKLKYRLTKHCSVRGNTHKDNWIKSLAVKGLVPIIIEIQSFLDRDILNQAEIFWIKYFKEMGCPLTNLTLGGEGTFGYVPTIETRKKIVMANTGRKHTEAARQKMSIAQKSHKKVYSIEARKKMSNIKKIQYRGSGNPFYGKKHKDVTKEKIARGLGGRPFLCLNNKKIYFTLAMAALELNVWEGNIRKVLKGKIRTTGGYEFQYLEVPSFS